MRQFFFIFQGFMAYLTNFIRIILLLFFVSFLSRNSYGTSFLSSNKKNTFLRLLTIHTLVCIVNLKGKKTFGVPCNCIFCIICLSSCLLTAFNSTLVDLDFSLKRRYWSPMPRLPDVLVLVFALMFSCIVSLVLITTSMGWIWPLLTKRSFGLLRHGRLLSDEL